MLLELIFRYEPAPCVIGFGNKMSYRRQRPPPLTPGSETEVKSRDENTAATASQKGGADLMRYGQDGGGIDLGSEKAGC